MNVVFIIIDVAPKVIYKLFLWTLSSTLSLWNSSKSHFSIGLNTVLTHHDPFLEFGTIRSNFWQLYLLVCMKTVKLNNIGRDSLVEAWSKALDFCTQTHKDLVKKTFQSPEKIALVLFNCHRALNWKLILSSPIETLDLCKSYRLV